jgi:hypothetical protein
LPNQGSSALTYFTLLVDPATVPNPPNGHQLTLWTSSMITAWQNQTVPALPAPPAVTTGTQPPEQDPSTGNTVVYGSTAGSQTDNQATSYVWCEYSASDSTLSNPSTVPATPTTLTGTAQQPVSCPIPTMGSFYYRFVAALADPKDLPPAGPTGATMWGDIASWSAPQAPQAVTVGASVQNGNTVVIQGQALGSPNDAAMTAYVWCAYTTDPTFSTNYGTVPASPATVTGTNLTDVTCEIPQNDWQWVKGWPAGFPSGWAEIYYRVVASQQPVPPGQPLTTGNGANMSIVP